VSKENRKVTKNDLFNMFARLHLFQGSLNFERMEALGYVFVMMPVLKRLYKTKEDMSMALKRHMEYFNTQTTVCSVIFGLTAAMEEQGGNEADRAIAGMKSALMGPLAGIGDSLIFSTWLPICMSIGAAMAASGNLSGPIIAWLLFNMVNVTAKYYGIMIGYNQGIAFIEKSKGELDKVTTLAAIVGLTVVGSLIPSLVAVSTPITIKIGELSIVLQEILDSIMPNLLPLAFTMFAFTLIRRQWSAIKIVLTLIVASLVFTGLGVII